MKTLFRLLLITLSMVVISFSCNVSADTENAAQNSDQHADKNASPAKPAHMTKGIYISQTTMEDTKYITYLAEQAKASGINEFIVDMEIPSKLYQKNLQILKDNNITYVARITMFPGGGTREQLASSAYIEKRYRLVQTAVNYGAQQIQLDYIRYNTKQAPSHQNAINVTRIIRLFKDRLAEKNIPLQVDVFGISSYGESKYIGQDVHLISQVVDAICPMDYPSHFTPFPEHFQKPYQTVYNSLEAIRDEIDDKSTSKLVPYIELSNYHFPLSKSKKFAYIYAQIRATQDAGADGWYAWSANNYYDNLFHVLQNYPVR